jgi:hypothetical protein
MEHKMAITPMKRRGKKGMAAPLWDLGDWTIVMGSDWRHDGSHRDFKVDLIHRIHKRREDMTNWSKGCEFYTEYKRRSLTIPTLKFRTAYNHKRWLMWYYTTQQKVLWWLVHR